MLTDNDFNNILPTFDNYNINMLYNKYLFKNCCDIKYNNMYIIDTINKLKNIKKYKFEVYNYDIKKSIKLKNYSGLVNAILNKFIIYNNIITEYLIEIINYEIIIYSSKNNPLYKGKWVANIKPGIYQLNYIYINNNFTLIADYLFDTNPVYFFEIQNIINK